MSLTMSSPLIPRGRSDFHVAILCALTLEAECVIDALDRRWTEKAYDPPANDNNSYTLGAIGEHNVVIVHMPGMGTVRAAAAVSSLGFSYPNVKLALVVGVCGGIPTGDEREEILLGDVVISKALVEYDFGKQYPDGFKRKIDVLDTLGPSQKILSLLKKLETRQHKKDLQTETAKFLYAVQQKSPNVEYPGLEHDILYHPTYNHKHHKPGQCRTCEMTDKVCDSASRSDCEALGCEPSMRVPRQRLLDPSMIQPVIHFGVMGCANTVMKSGHHRDTLARKEGIIALEMEGAGVWRHGQSIVIKGVCDYADSHKRKTWQRYAAATAAACTKAFLLEWRSPEKQDDHSDQGPANAYLDNSKRYRVETPSDREEISRSMGPTPIELERRALRSKNDPLEQLDSSDGKPPQPNRHLAENLHDESVGMDNVKSSRDLLSKQKLSWKDYSQSLEFKQMNDWRRSDKRNAKGTCEWLLTSSEYEQWMREKGFFIVRGNPGSGKSTLIKYTLMQQQLRAAQESPIVMNISFFFNDHGTEAETSMHGMLRSLLWQLVEEDEESREPFRELCYGVFGTRARKKDDLVWETHDLRAVFEKLSVEASTRHDVKVFVDAIDECQDRDHEDFVQFFRFLNNSSQAYPGKIGVFVTSRKQTVIPVGSSITIQLEDKNQEDIRSFLIEQLQLLDETQEARDSLKTFLEHRAEGSFLWIVLVMPRVRTLSGRGVHPAKIKSEILQCPQELNRLYAKLLEDIKEAKSSEIIALFQWIYSAVRPLSIEELRVALTIHVSKAASSMEEYARGDNDSHIQDGHQLRKKVRHLSQGLVDFSSVDLADKDTLVRFYHGSIKDFMREKGLDVIRLKTRHTYDLAEAASAELTNTCLRFLSAEEIHTAMLESNTDRLSQYAFFAYARDHWHEHAVDAEKNGTADSIDWTLWTVLPAWIHIQQHLNKRPRSHFPRETKPIHIAARYGLVKLASMLLGNNTVNESAGVRTTSQLAVKSPVRTSSKHSNPLSSISARNDKSLHTGRKPPVNTLRLSRTESRASYRPHDVVVTSACGIEGGNRKSRSTSLSRTNKVQNNSLPVTKRRPRVGMLDVRDARGSTPLMLAASAGQLAMVQLLCELQADTRSRDKLEWTPLLAASVQGHADVVKYLLNHGAAADINATIGESYTRWNTAVDKNYWPWTDYVRENGIDRNVAIEAGWTPLSAASIHGHLEVVRCLLECGTAADVNTATEEGWTALYAASSKGHSEVVRYLLQRGADVHISNKADWTPLCVASDKGHLKVVKCLLEYRTATDIRAVTEAGRTPLHLASAQGHLKVVEYLLQKGANIRASDNSGWTSLCLASGKGRLKVVEYMLKHGAEADIHIPTKTGQTPLYSASVQGQLEVVEYLFEHGADIHTPNKYDWTPLNAASSNAYLDVVKYLYERGADINTPNLDGWTPLCSASDGGHLDVVKYLIEHGADIHTSTENGWTPLHLVSDKGHLDVVKYLIEHGADIHTPIEGGWTPLHLASLGGHLDVVKHLIEHGANIHIFTKKGRSPLDSASSNGYIEVVKHLIEQGADISARSKLGWTPLQSASNKGHLDVVKYLIEHGANVHTSTENRWTPLYGASRYGHLATVQLLLEAGAVVNLRGGCGQTPLICSVAAAHKDVSQLLIRFSADATLIDDFGRTAADWLKLLRTDDELLKIICPNPDSPPETNTEHLNTSIVSVSMAIIGRQAEDSGSLFNDLGYYLLTRDDIEHAYTAFLQVIETTTVKEAETEHAVFCSLCSAWPIKSSRFVCKTCPDTDLCQSCMDKYRDGEHFAACNAHEYLEISGLDFTPMNRDALLTWLQDLVKLYTSSP